MITTNQSWLPAIAFIVSLTIAADPTSVTVQTPTADPPPEAALSEPTFNTPADLLRYGQDQKTALKVNEAIYQALGFGNTFMVLTPEGNVIVDTASVQHAPHHKELLRAVSTAPIKYIVLTHAHADHTGGVPLWKEAQTQIVAQRQYVDFMHYQSRLEGFFARRNAAQFSRPVPPPRPWPGNFGASIAPTVLFDDEHEFELGGLKFQVLHTPGDTYDHATVWIPRYKTAFIGDNFSRSFPNLYTLRGTQPRWALDYVQSLNRILALEPEIVLPSHGLPIRGKEAVVAQLTRYRDAIQYVHDEVVKGMNAGKDAHTLMREIKLPAELDLGEGYGRVSGLVRGIYEGYVGWFDLKPATMYDQPASAVYPDLVKLAGGPDSIARLAKERVEAGQPVEALHLTEIALTADPQHRATLEARLKALDLLIGRCRNTNERGWLDYSLMQTKEQLHRDPPTKRD